MKNKAFSLQLLFTIILVSTIARALHNEPTKAQISAAYRQAKNEDIRFRTVGVASIGLLGAIGINAAIKNRYNTNSKIVIGSVLGMGLMPLAYLALMNGYYAKKYGVSLKVADAARLTVRPLSLTSVKQMFLDAEKKDKEGLRNSLSKVLEQEMGKNWYEKLQEKLQSNSDAFDGTLHLLAVLENVYSSKLYTGGETDPFYIRIAAQKLMKNLNMM